DVIVVRTRIDVSVAGRDDTCRDRAAEAERITNCDHPFSQPQPVGIAELDCFERLLGRDAKQSNVGLLVLAYQFRLEPRPVVENDRDLVGFRYDVIIGHDYAGWIDDEPGPERVDATRPAFAVLLIALAAPVEEVAEQ